MNGKFKIEHTITPNELLVYNVIVSKLDFGEQFLSLKEIQEKLDGFSSSQILCLLNQLKERVIVIYNRKAGLEISTTLFKFDYVFVQQTEVYLNFENVELFDVEFKHYLGNFRSNQAYQRYESLDFRFNYYKNKVEEKNYSIVVDDWATNLIKKTSNKLDNKA